MYHFIVNIHGGSGKAFVQWNKIRAMLKERGVEYVTHVPQRPGHASQIAARIAGEGDGDINLVILGGDGTINEVLNGIPQDKLCRFRLGLIPTGSGNDFSRGLGLPRHNPRKALDIVLSSDGSRRIDLGVVESDDPGARFPRRLFGISAGFGLDALVGTSINKSKIKVVLNRLRMGKLSYALLTIKSLFSLKTHDVSVSFDGGDPIEFRRVIFCAAMNFRAEGGGVPMAPDARGDDGKLSVCLVSGVPKFLTFFMFPVLLLGMQRIFKSFYLRDFESMRLVSSTPAIVATDGESFGFVRNVRYTVIKGAVRVLI